ncbi:amidase family protein [Allosalinactinospora lopnorensis]|uniref:amidase family protein n=1 Tax=Allosalinactinospora lopnorensis TaxID=1352348 RepID=UPI0009E590B8|nr:amidase family protein [Allosalinactinospora lopnorensis]
MRSSEPDPATAWPAVADIADRVSGGSASAEEFARAALQRATREDERLRAFREVWPEHAVRVARQIDAAVVRGATFPLAGVPIAVKAWGGTTSAIADRLIAAGCVPLGATSVPGPGTDYQTWGSTERGPTRNPWCPDRVPGGSSAGSAAAVAAGIVPLATGGDSAGSIRIPAAWCGVLGMKPTNAWLPTRRGDGLGALGPLAANAGDLATVLDVLFPRQEGRFTRALSTETPRSAVWSPTLASPQPMPTSPTAPRGGWPP